MTSAVNEEHDALDLSLNRNGLRDQTRRIVLAEERERRRIAQGLHDSVCHKLAMAKVKLNLLCDTGDARERGVSASAEVLELLDAAIRETRSLTFELASPVLYELGLEPAIHSLCQQLSRETGIRFHCETGPAPLPQLPRERRVLIYRALREFLRNIIKHANVRCAQIRMRQIESWLHIRVEDDGVGFDVASVTKCVDGSSGFGLFSVRDEFEAAGGRVEIESSPRVGTRIDLVAPFEGLNA